MAGKPIEEWCNPSPITCDDGGLSSGESTSYEEEVPTPPIEKKGHNEEDKDPNYTPTADRPSTQNSRTLAREQADDEDRMSK